MKILRHLLIMCLPVSVVLCGNAADSVHGTTVEPPRELNAPPMTKGELAYLKAMNQQFEAMTQQAQSHGYNHKLPKLLFVRTPQIPRKQHGTVTVSAIATAQGTFAIENGLGGVAPNIGVAISDAIRLWRCEPPMIDGKPVNIRVELPFDF